MKKKLFTLMLSITTVFVLGACIGGGGNGEETAVNIPDSVPEEEIVVDMDHAFGDDNQALIDQAMEDFPYDNITLNQVSRGGYEGLREATMHAMVSGTTPDIIMGYPDHFVGYLTGQAMVPLQDYMEHEEFGIDEDDFVDSFMEENQQYQDGNQYSLPFAKSTEMIVYNRDVFENHGISMDDRDFVYWSDVEAWSDDLLNDCGKVFNMDSPDNQFIIGSAQWGAPYTTDEGEVLLDNDTTRDMLNYFSGLIDDDILAYPQHWDDNFGSQPFKDGEVCMTQGSTGGARYNIPEPGTFEAGFMPSIQYEDGDYAAIQQGPNIGIMSNNTEEERLAAWLIIKHLLNPENTAEFSMATGYMPVRDSSFELDFFSDFLSIVDQDFADLDPDEQDQYAFAQAVDVGQQQFDIMSFEPAFTGDVSSAAVRLRVGQALESIHAGTRDVDESIQWIYDQLRIN